MIRKFSTLSAIMASTALGGLATHSTAAHAQDAEAASGLQEIVVTAQKREQSLQDVPIAMTALTANALEANRVVSVQDLNGLAPNLTVRPSAGGIGVPSFTMRGVTSYGVVPGSDKQVSIYIDGVYLGSSRGSMFDLPDIARIEVLRGPQGTLFGRNATAGAVSIVTRDPTGEAGAKQQFTFGNYGQFRTRTTIDLPAWGPFSAYASYVHDKRRGDIRNLGADTFWDRTGPNTGWGADYSSKYLGDRDADNIFAAVKFEPSDNFVMTYKFDRAINHYSAEGTALIGYDASAPLLGNLINALVTSQPTPYPIASDGKRPNTVNNSWVVPSYQRTTGHNLTATLRLNDTMSLKNIASYRKVFANTTAQIDGLGGLMFTQQALVPYATFAVLAANPSLATSPQLPMIIGQTAAALAPAVGQRFCVICNHNQQKSEQWSDELQFNYDSDLLSLVVGGLYFHQKDQAGAPPGMPNNYTFSTVSSSGRLSLGKWSTTDSKATSLAGYAQAEVHVTPQLDLVLGGRLTYDKKSGILTTGGVFVPGPNGYIDGTFTGLVNSRYTYKKTKPTFSVGANFKPRPGILLYGKYATAFVSGGSVADVRFDPETVVSFEIGAKADFFERRLRANLALFHAKYKHQQSAQSGSNVGRPDLSTIIIDSGERTAKGFELELTALPIAGVTLNAGLGYTDIKLSNVNPILIASGGGVYEEYGIPKWTSNLSAQYETPELFDEARMTFRVDATWHSRRQNTENPAPYVGTPLYDAFAFTDASWIVNGRVALRDVAVGPMKIEVAGWVRNLTNNRESMFPLRLQNIFSSTFVPARTYGVDIGVTF